MSDETEVVQYLESALMRIGNGAGRKQVIEALGLLSPRKDLWTHYDKVCDEAQQANPVARPSAERLAEIQDWAKHELSRAETQELFAEIDALKAENAKLRAAIKEAMRKMNSVCHER